MNALPQLPTSLIDCTEETDNELFVVEGLSAANALKAVRNRATQAVLPMQGKIPNAMRVSGKQSGKRSGKRLLDHPNVADLLQSLHPQRIADPQLPGCRYQRVVVLGDPDADGVHASILLLAFMLEYLPWLFEEEKLILLRAPLYGFYRSDTCVGIAYGDQHAIRVHDALMKKTDTVLQKRRFKGIASFDSSLRLALLAKNNPARKVLTLQDGRELCQALQR